MEKPSLSSQEWPKLSPSPNEESVKKTELKNKKCDECTFVTHKTYNLKNHKKIHMKVTKEPMEVLKCHECQKSFSNKKTLGDHIRHTHNKEKEKNKKCFSCPFETHKTYNLKIGCKIDRKGNFIALVPKMAFTRKEK